MSTPYVESILRNSSNSRCGGVQVGGLRCYTSCRCLKLPPRDPGRMGGGCWWNGVLSPRKTLLRMVASPQIHVRRMPAPGQPVESWRQSRGASKPFSDLQASKRGRWSFTVLHEDGPRKPENRTGGTGKWREGQAG